MKFPSLIFPTMLAASPVSAQTPLAAQAKPQIRAILLEEAYRPPAAPAPGETAWDMFEQGIYKLRKARQIYADAKSWSTGIERPAEEWARSEKRIARMESAYKNCLFPGLHAIYLSFVDSRVISADADLSLTEREYFAQNTPPSPGWSGKILRFDPNKKNIQGLHTLREEGAGYSIQAEELLDKGLKQLRQRGPKRTPPAPDYLNDLISEAEDLLDKAAARGLEVARAQTALHEKKGLFDQAIEATKTYGGLDGKGPYEEPARAKAVQLLNEAKKSLVLNEYRTASRVEEVRTLDYLINTFAKP